MSKKKGGNWIAGAIKHPGALHKSLGVPAGKKIPASKLRAAAKGDSKTAKRARLAITLKGMHHGMQMGPSGFGMSHGDVGAPPAHEFKGGKR